MQFTDREIQLMNNYRKLQEENEQLAESVRVATEDFYRIRELREQLAAAQATIEQMREAFISVCCDPDGNVCVGVIGGTYADKEILEQALALQPHASLVAKIKADAVREAASKILGIHGKVFFDYADRLEQNTTNIEKGEV